MKSNKKIISWIAGFWEGEGCISKVKSTQGYVVTIAQALRENRTVREPMELLKKLFKGELYEHKPGKAHYKTQIQWILNKRQDVLYFLKCIYPYCFIRKQDVKIAIDYLKLHPLRISPWQETYKKIKNYRKKGYTNLKISKLLKITRNRIYHIMSYNLDIT